MTAISHSAHSPPYTEKLLVNAMQVRPVPLDQIEPDPNQPRKTFSEESLRGLAETMKARQIQPILVFRRGDRLVIIDGERRWRAAKLASLATIDAIVLDQAPLNGVCRLWQLIANSQEDLPPLEKAEAIHLLMEEMKWSLTDTAQRLGESAGNLSKLLSLVEAPTDVRDAVKAGLPASTAYELTHVEDAEQRQALIQDVTAKRLSRDALSRKIKRIQREEQNQPSGTLTRATALLGEGRSVTVNGCGLSIETLVEWLDLLLAKARKARTRGLSLETFIRTLRDETRTQKAGAS